MAYSGNNQYGLIPTSLIKQKYEIKIIRPKVC